VAAASLLADHGYSDFSIEKRAAIAEVSRTSIYCGEESKGGLLLDLYVEDIVAPMPMTSGEDVFDSLEYYLQLSVVEFSSDSRYNALKPIVAEAQTDLELDVLSRQRLILP
jgi:hypothetical protein